MYMPSTRWTWAFMMTTLFQAAIALGLEGFVFAQFQISLKGKARSTTESRTIPCYLSLFIFGFLYQLVIVWDALRLKNTIQIIGLCAFNVAMLIYAAVQYDQIYTAVGELTLRNEIAHDFWQDVHPFLIAVPCVIALGTLIMSGIAWKLYDEFAWTIYKHISADLRLKRRYLTYQIYIALLKFDFFFFLAFTVQFLVVVGNTTNIEFYLTIVAIPITIGILLLAGLFTRRETVLGMIAIMFLYLCALAYFLFKLVRMYDESSPAAMMRVADYKPARRSLTTFAVITIFLLIVTLINNIWCTKNFNKGLKPHLRKRKPLSPDDKLYAYGGNTGAAGPAHALGAVPSRMTID